MTPPRLRVAHVITDLQTGGAEVMLLRACERADRQRIEPRVISLKQTHPIGDRIAELGVPVEALGMGAFPSPAAIARLAAALREVDVVQTWMIHADLVGSLGALLGGRVPIAWGVHFGRLERSTHGAASVAVAQANGLLARLMPLFVPHVVVACSETSRTSLRRMGYPEERIRVQPNGFDLERFRRDPAAGASVRAELGLPEGALVVGQLTRAHPQKDQPTMLAAAAPLLDRQPRAHLVMAGRGIDDQSAELRALLEGWPAARRARVHLLGARSDTPRLLSAFDLLCSSSSYGEAFPLVLGEAMACEVPCVATDCGDSALLIGDTGRVVPIQDPPALCAALDALLSLPEPQRRDLGARARASIAARFELTDVVRSYEALWAELAARRR